MVRTPYREGNGIKKRLWTAKEDRKLIAYVTRYGCWNWRQLPKFAGLSRPGKSCRLRWMTLRPNNRGKHYTQEEESMIIQLHEEFGNKWSIIAAKLPGRREDEIKNHWHTHLKKFIDQIPTASAEGWSGWLADCDEMMGLSPERCTGCSHGCQTCG